MKRSLDKNFLVGVLVGVVVVLGLQWGVEFYAEKKVEKRAEAFLTGYQNASNKTTFVQNYDWDGDGKISLSSAGASEGDSCAQLQNDIIALIGIINYIWGKAGHDDYFIRQTFPGPSDDPQSYAYNTNLLPSEYGEYKDLIKDVYEQYEEKQKEWDEKGCVAGGEPSVSE